MTLKRAKENYPAIKGSQMLVLALKTSRADLLVKTYCPQSPPERKAFGSQGGNDQHVGGPSPPLGKTAIDMRH